MQIVGLVKSSGAGNTIYAPTRVMSDGRVHVVQSGDVVVATAGQMGVIDGNLRVSQELNLEVGCSLHMESSGAAALWGKTRLQGGVFQWK